MAQRLQRRTHEDSLQAQTVAIMPVPIHTTMLELVRCVSAVAETDYEIVATVTYLVNTGKVVLRGSFAGERLALS